LAILNFFKGVLIGYLEALNSYSGFLLPSNWFLSLNLKGQFFFFQLFFFLFFLLGLGFFPFGLLGLDREELNLDSSQFPNSFWRVLIH